MFKVTDRAKAVISKSLSKKKVNDNIVFRIKKTEADQKKLGLIVGRELKSDMVVKNNDGLKVLVINSNLANNLSTVTLDVQNTSEGNRFILTDAKSGV